jgi:hypothetical protein
MMKKYSVTDLDEGIKGIEEVQRLKEKHVEYIKKNKKKKGPSLLEDIAETQQKMMSYSKLITDELSLFRELINPETQERKTRQIKDHYSKFNKAELIEELVKARLLIEGHELRISVQNQKISVLDEFYDNHQRGRIEKNKSKQKGKERTYKSNNDCLEQCYKAFSKTLEAPVRSIDYPAYKRFLLKLYPHPPFIPEARLTAKEKQQSIQIQNEDRDLKARYTWSDATVRVAFRKFSGAIATTLKK